MQASVCLHLAGRAVHLEHSSTVCYGLIRAALEKDKAPEHLLFFDGIIIWGNMAEEVFEKGEKITQILLKVGSAIKQCKIKGPAQEIGVKWQDEHCRILMDMVKKTAKY